MKLSGVKPQLANFSANAFRLSSRIGSEPEYATRQRLRSSRSSAESLTRALHSW